MDTLAIRDKIKTELETAGAENVYTEDPLLVDWEAVIDNIRQQNREFMQCWVIRRVASIPNTSETNLGRVPIGCEVHWNHTYEITMFFAYLASASEDQMQTLIDMVLVYFQSLRTFGDLVFGITRPLGLQSLRPSELGGVGGYEARFALTVYAIEQGVSPS